MNRSIDTPITVAVTGLENFANPGPAVGIAECLKKQEELPIRIVALTTDYFATGIYLRDLIDSVVVLPDFVKYEDDFWEAFTETVLSEQIQILFPGKREEIAFFSKHKEKLQEFDLKGFWPDNETLKILDPLTIDSFCRLWDIPFLEGVYYNREDDLYFPAEESYYPFEIFKPGGQNYKVDDQAEAEVFARKLANDAGYPIGRRQYIEGQNFSVMLVRCSERGMLGIAATSEIYTSDSGVPWILVTVNNDELVELSEKISRRLNWNGPLELKFRQDEKTEKVYLKELAPVFSHWTPMTAFQRDSLPLLAVKQLLGIHLERIESYPTGLVLANTTQDVLWDMSTFAKFQVEGRTDYDR